MLQEQQERNDTGACEEKKEKKKKKKKKKEKKKNLAKPTDLPAESTQAAPFPSFPAPRDTLDMTVDCTAVAHPLRAQPQVVSPTDLAMLRRLGRHLKRALNQAIWRRLWQRRCSTISAVNRAIEAALDQPVRVKGRCRWTFWSRAAAARAPIAILHVRPVACFADFAVPLELEVLAPDQIDGSVIRTRLAKLGVTIR